MVAAVALVAFVVAVVSFRGAPASHCLGRADVDTTYRVDGMEPVYIDDSGGYRFTVLREGRPVEGASVCLRAGLGGPEGLPELAVADAAREISPGVYQAAVIFEARGEWTGRVVVGEPGGRPVQVPITIDVQGEAPS